MNNNPTQMLIALFEENGWEYRTRAEYPGLLEASFGGQSGAVRVLLHAPTTQQLKAEALQVAMLEPGEEALFNSLQAQLTQFRLAYDPTDGEVRLPLTAELHDTVSQQSLHNLLSILLGATDVVRLALARMRAGADATSAVQHAQHQLSPGSAPQSDLDAVAVQEALNRAQRLLLRLGQAEDQAAFLQEHLDEFDDETIAALSVLGTQAHQQGKEDFARALANLLSTALSLRAEQDPELRARLEQAISER